MSLWPPLLPRSTIVIFTNIEMLVTNVHHTRATWYSGMEHTILKVVCCEPAEFRSGHIEDLRNGTCPAIGVYGWV